MSIALETPHRPVRGLRRAIRHEIRSASRAASAAPPDVHTARRHLKRARSLARLGRAAWPDGGRRLRRALGRAGRALGGLRDAEARAEAVAALVGHPETPGPDALRALDRRLRAERDRTRHRVSKGGPDPALRNLREAKRILRATQPRGRGRGLTVFEPGLRRMIGDGRSAVARTRRQPDDAAAWHALRKRAKDLRYAAEFLAPTRPEEFTPLALELHDLTDRLGDANDLTLVLDHLSRRRDLVPETDRPAVASALHDARRAHWRAAEPTAARLWEPPVEDFVALLIGWARGTR